MIKQSFTLRVLAVCFILLALPLIIDSFIFFQDSYDDAINEAKSDLREIANLRSYLISTPLPVQQIMLKELIYLLDLEKPFDQINFDKIDARLQKMTTDIPNLQVDVLKISHDGKFPILASTDQKKVGTKFISFEMLPRLIEEGSGVFFRYVPLEGGARYAPFGFLARTVFPEDRSEPSLVLLAASDLGDLFAHSLKETGSDHRIKFAFLTSDGIAFAGTDDRLVGNYFARITQQRLKEIIESKQLGDETPAEHPLPVVKGEDPPFFEFIFGDRIQIGYKASISDLHISVVAYASKEAYFAKMVRHFLLIYCMYGVILVAGGALAYWLSTWISHPLRQLSFVMEEVRSGNLDVRFQSEPFGYEINILGGIFNHTLETLFSHIQKTQDERIRKETYQRELAIGREVQMSLLTTEFPEIPGGDLSAIFRPGLIVGGSYYGFYGRTSDSGEEMVMLSVANAAGSGISSSLYALAARSLIHTYATYIDDVGEVLTKANEAFITDAGETGMFITTVLAAYHATSRRLEYTNCGHEPGVMRKADGTVEVLDHASVALGVSETEVYQATSVTLEPGDYVIFYSHGLLEVENEAGEKFTQERLINKLRTHNWEKAQEIVSGIQAELESFIGGRPQEEEVIVVALKVR